MKCFFGFHKRKKPYYARHHHGGKMLRVPKFVHFMLVSECENCGHKDYSLTTKFSGYDNWEEELRKLNKVKTPLEELL